MKSLAKGFTLIELLVVVTLIGIMIAIAVPSFATFISNYRATTSINDLLQAVTQTRAEALKRGRKVILLPKDNPSLTTFSTSGNWKNGWAVFQLISTASSYDANSVTNAPVAVHGALFGSITVSGAGSTTPFNGRNYVAFDGSGYPGTNASGSNVAIASTNSGIVLTNTTGSTTTSRTLCLAAMGRPRIVQAVDACVSG